MAGQTIGVDVGGSKVAACLFDTGSSTAVDTVRLPTRADRGSAAVLDVCVAAVDELLSRGVEGADQLPLGIGLCELVSETGAVRSAATVDWRGIDIAGAFGSRPLVVDSDVRVAGVAEARLGAGRSADAFVYLSVGTGIAFTLVLEGRPYAGARGSALILGAPPVEGVASGAALAAAAGLSTAEEVFEGAAHAAILERGAHELGCAMAWLVNALDPEILVVGGGLGLRDDYREAAVATMRSEVGDDIAVVPAELGADAGAIGAALIAADRHAVPT